MPEGGRKNDEYGGFRDHPPALVDLAVTQHAVFRLDQLAALGLSARAVHRRAANGQLHRIHQAVYSLVPLELLTRDGRFMAAALACGKGAAISHRCAAELLELRRTGQRRIDVTIPRRTPRSHEGLAVHRSTTLTPNDLTAVRNIPVTVVARTLLDLAEIVNRRDLERILDQAEILEALNLRAIRDQLQRNPTRKAAGILQTVLEEHYAGTTPTWSELEERFLALLRDTGLPQPQVNAFIVLHDGEPAIRVDFVWRSERLIVETDGHRTHHTRQAFERDRRNDQRLMAAGWRVVRITWRQILREPRRVAQTVARLLER